LGGIYLDTDIEPIHSLDPLLQLGAFTVCEYPPNRIIQGNAGNMIMSQSRCVYACNAVIGAVPAHLALLKALTDSVTNTQKRLTSVSFFPKDYSTAISGPPAWTKAAKQEGVQFLIPKTFYPCNYDESGNDQRCSASILSRDPSIFASHLWLKSWV
jgi:hypothetical protein